MRKTLPEMLDIIGKLLTLAAEDTTSSLEKNELVLSFVPDDEILRKVLKNKGGSLRIILKEIPTMLESELTINDPSSGYMSLNNDDFQVITPPNGLNPSNLVPTLMSKSHVRASDDLPTWGRLWELCLKKLRIIV